jgi:hypothetical protein
MNQTEIFRDFTTLPPEAQRIVADLVVLLRKQNEHAKRVRKIKPTRLVDEKFIGIWEDRQEMQDSSAYVRGLRQNEWGVTKNAGHR